MQYNRKLLISSAGSRKATVWPKSTILWSEFADRLKTPVRSSETYEQYLAMTKAQQAELKDVGGFVGGTFMGDRRKPEYAEGRARQMIFCGAWMDLGARQLYTAPVNMQIMRHGSVSSYLWTAHLRRTSTSL